MIRPRFVPDKLVEKWLLGKSVVTCNFGGKARPTVEKGMRGSKEPAVGNVLIINEIP